MKPAITFLTLASLVALGGCFPNATVYYRPTVDVESTHEKSHCVPTEKYVHFTINTRGQALKVRGYGESYSLAHAEGTEAQYVISGTWKEIGYKNSDFRLSLPGRSDTIKPEKTYAERHDHDGYSTFNSGAVFPRQKAESFEVTFPTLVVDGEEIELPILRVRKTIWTGISPFNC